MTKPSLDQLRVDYQDNASRTGRLKDSLVDQLSRLFNFNEVTLGVPIESRVKTWASVEDKINRKSKILASVTDLDDLVGIRVILLFRKDVVAVGSLLRETFDIVSIEDTGSRLEDAQFGYQSQHYIISVPSSWATIPTFSDLQGRRAEIQVRTLTQHIWAAVSHKLQYKQEESVPPPVRRSIYRVSALLETVDLEFDRVLEERDRYINNGLDRISPTETLNVDLLAATLAEILPERNRGLHEPYSELLSDLFHFDIASVGQFRALLNKHLIRVMEADEMAIKKHSAYTIERNSSGGFFVHVGLARQALRLEFGSKADTYFKAKPALHRKLKAASAAPGPTTSPDKPATRAPSQKTPKRT